MNMFTKTFMRSLAAAMLAVGLALPAYAHHDGEIFEQAGIQVSHAWTVETSAKAHAVEVYMTLENTGDRPVVLTGAEIDFAAPGVFQAQTIDSSGTLKTTEVARVEIAPGQSVTMQPGGLRLVFNDVKRVLHAGDHFHAHLDFAGVGEMEIEVDVEHSDEHDHGGVS